MRRILIAASLAMFASPALAVDAQEAEPTGECRVKMNTDYAKVSINDEDYSAVEYAANGKHAFIKNLSMDEFPIRVTMRPIYEELEEITFELNKKDFKRKREGRVYLLVATKTLTFKKKKGGDKKPDTPKPPDEPEKRPEKKPDAPDDL